MDQGSALQCVSTSGRTGLYRPSDRLRYGRHERPPVERHDDGRRELCRRPLVLQDEGNHRAHHRFPDGDPDASGPCRRERGVQRTRESRRRGAGQLAFRHHQGSYREPQGVCRGLHHRRGPRHPAGASLQGQRGHRQAGEGRDRQQGARAVHHRDHHQQYGRRTAHISSRPARRVTPTRPSRR